MKSILKNRWFKFSLSTVIYILLFVVWPGNAWMILGIVLLYDFFISRLFHKYVWTHVEDRCRKDPVFNWIYGWVDAIVWAVVVATLIHLFVFQLYMVPTSSMEATILTGDYLYVSKLSYGPQVPNTPVAMPFVYNTMPFSTTRPSYSECIRWPYHRLKGFGHIERNDVVVFNFPAGDTVLLENQAVTYYDVKREYMRHFGKEEGERLLRSDYTIQARPVDKRENYIKRCVAIPGDSIRIIDDELYVNGVPQDPTPTRQHGFVVRTSGAISDYAFSKLGINEYQGSAPYYFMHLTDDMAEKVRGVKVVDSVEMYVCREHCDDVFPNDPAYQWTQDNFGPIWIPERGKTIDLTPENLPFYRRIIEQYEGHTLQVDGERIIIDSVPSTKYTFAMNYYWMMGDNRHNSADSRFWGFVPEDHIVGKALFIAFSKSQTGEGIRWNRIFSRIR